jgi:hypothetical protein
MYILVGGVAMTCVLLRGSVLGMLLSLLTPPPRPDKKKD